MVYTPETWINGSAPYLNATNLNHMESGIAANQGGHHPFSTFSGADDDAKLVSAVSYVNAQTYKSAVVLDESRYYTFDDQHPTPGDGFHLTGPLGATSGQPEQSSKNTSFARAKINYSGTWISLPTTRWNLRYSNIDFVGNSGSTWMNSSTQTLWRLQLWNLGFNQFYGVLGNAGSKCLMTACDTWGQWDVANSYNTAFRIGGSDNNLFMDGMFLDSGITSGVTDGTEHFWADYLSKSNLGPIYCTARNNWTGLYVTGSSTNGSGLIQLPGARWEGKNESEYCRGATIRVNSGSLTILGSAVNFGMGASNARGDSGTIHHAGGALAVYGVSHARADNTTSNTPFIYSTGGELTVAGIQKSTQGGNTWSDKPVVYVSSGGDLLYTDASVRVDPIKERPVRVYAGASAPTNPRKGDLHIDSGAGGFQIWSGSAWNTTRVT